MPNHETEPTDDHTTGPDPLPTGADEELVDVPGGPGETIRTLDFRDIPDGSGNDSSDPGRRPDDDEERYDAG